MVKRVGAGKILTPPGTAGKATPVADPSTSAFRQILESTYKEREVIFSAHARSRLENRDIKFFQ